MLMPLSSYPFLYELESSQQMLSNRDDSGIFALFLTNSISVPFSNMPIIFLFSFHYFFPVDNTEDLIQAKEMEVDQRYEDAAL